MTALLGVVAELCKRDPDPRSIAESVLGDLSTEQQRESAREAFAEYVRLSLQAMRRRGYSIREVAVALGVNRKQVEALINSGELGCVPVGRLKVVPDHELDRFLSKAVAA